MSINPFLLLACAVLSVQCAWSMGWTDNWRIESESPDWKVTPLGGDTLELVAPKGLTCWYQSPFHGDVTVEYDATVVTEGKPYDRLSDLNLFWKASDPKAATIWERMGERQGIFKRCSALQLYYLGYGGNSNRTTRFRRYDGNPDPRLLKEYTDSSHLLVPHKWYHIKIESRGSHVRISVNQELLVDYLDEHPLKDGWFGFRTTHSRTRIANFHYSYPSQKKHHTLIQQRVITD